MSQLSEPDATYRWITDFLTDRKQHLRLGKIISDSLTLSIGALQGCLFSPLFYSLSTNYCTPRATSVKLLMFTDNTSLIGLIQDGNELVYRQELTLLVSAGTICSSILLKTVEVVVDLMRRPSHLLPLILSGTVVIQVESFRFLGDLTKP